MIDEIDLVGLIAEHQRWLRLCARLEAVADALPERPTMIEVAALRAQLRNLLPDGGAMTDFPLRALFVREAAEPLGHRLLERLRLRRSVLSAEAQDLEDMIAPEAQERVAADTLGYMLRCVFTTCREVAMLELLALLVIAPARLTQAARAVLIERLGTETARP
jgi:hypothetical protein